MPQRVLRALFLDISALAAACGGNDQPASAPVFSDLVDRNVDESTVLSPPAQFMRAVRLAEPGPGS